MARVAAAAARSGHSSHRCRRRRTDSRRRSSDAVVLLHALTRVLLRVLACARGPSGSSVEAPCCKTMAEEEEAKALTEIGKLQRTDTTLADEIPLTGTPNTKHLRSVVHAAQTGPSHHKHHRHRSNHADHGEPVADRLYATHAEHNEIHHPKERRSKVRRSSVHEIRAAVRFEHLLPPAVASHRERRASDGSHDVPVTHDPHNGYTRGTLWVGDIPDKQAKDHGSHKGPITTFFSKWGPVLSVTVCHKPGSKKPNPNWAFVTFVDHRDAKRVLAEHEAEAISMSDGTYEYPLDVQEARVKSELQTHGHAKVLGDVWDAHKHKDAAAAEIMRLASGTEVRLSDGRVEGEGKTPEQKIGIGRGRNMTQFAPGKHPHKDGGVWVSTVVDHSEELAEYLVWLRTDSEVSRLVPTHGELVTTIRRAVGVPRPAVLAAAGVSVALCIILLFVFIVLFIGASGDVSALESLLADKNAEISRMVLPDALPPSCTSVTVSDGGVTTSENTALTGKEFTIEVTTANCGGALSHVALLDPASGANTFLACVATSEDPECVSGTACVHRCMASVAAGELQAGLYEVIPVRYDYTSQPPVKATCGTCSNAIDMVGRCGSAVYGSDGSNPSTLDVTVHECASGIGSISVDGQNCELPSDYVYDPLGPSKQSISCTLATPVGSNGFTAVSVRAVDNNDCGTCSGVSCGQNQHVVNHVCQDCAPGSTRVAGDVAAGPDTECTATQCGENHFVRNHACEPCAAGKTRPRQSAKRERLCSLTHVFRGLCPNLEANLATGVDTQCWPSRCDTDMADVCPANYDGDDCLGGRYACVGADGFHGDRCCWGTCSTTGICD